MFKIVCTMCLDVPITYATNKMAAQRLKKKVVRDHFFILRKHTFHSCVCLVCCFCFLLFFF